MPAQGNCDGTQYQVIGFSSYPRPYLKSGDVNEKLDRDDRISTRHVSFARASYMRKIMILWLNPNVD
jgi:hypothetical protein